MSANETDPEREDYYDNEYNEMNTTGNSENYSDYNDTNTNKSTTGEEEYLDIDFKGETFNTQVQMMHTLDKGYSELVLMAFQKGSFLTSMSTIITNLGVNK